MDYLSQLLEIEDYIRRLENYITDEIKNIMTENNYVRFYKRQNDWVFVDSENNTIRPDSSIQSTIDHYYNIIQRPDFDIYG